MAVIKKVGVGEQSNLVIVAKAWAHKNEKTGVTYMSGNLSNTIGELTLKPTDVFFLFPNKKRTEINPKTNKVFNDADFVVCIEGEKKAA